MWFIVILSSLTWQYYGPAILVSRWSWFSTAEWILIEIEKYSYQMTHNLYLKAELEYWNIQKSSFFESEIYRKSKNTKYKKNLRWNQFHQRCYYINNDFNAINYQYYHFGISSFIYIRNYVQWYVSAKSGVKSIGNPNISTAQLSKNI